MVEVVGTWIKPFIFGFHSFPQLLQYILLGPAELFLHLLGEEAGNTTHYPQQSCQLPGGVGAPLAQHLWFSGGP